MKKSAAVFLLTLLLGPFCLVFLSLQAEKETLRRDLKHRMMETEDESSFVHMAFANDDLETELDWEHDNEFEYRGEMYDVVERETRGDSTYFSLWWDKDETELNRKLAKLIKTKHQEETPAQNLLKNIKVFQSFTETEIRPVISENNTPISEYIRIYKDPFISIPLPPPRA